MRPALPVELYEIFALPGVLYENLALIRGHCMEYTLACIWCYYYDDGLEIYIYIYIYIHIIAYPYNEYKIIHIQVVVMQLATAINRTSD